MCERQINVDNYTLNLHNVMCKCQDWGEVHDKQRKSKRIIGEV